jgi:hypothetical protein
VERSALVVLIATRHGEQIRSVLHRLRKAHDNFRIARAHDLQALGLTEDRRRLPAEIEPAQRDCLFLHVDEPGKHHDLLPPIEIVKTDMTLVSAHFLTLTLTTCERWLCDACGAQRHHCGRGEPATHSLHSSVPPRVSTGSNRRSIELDRR